jgi:hypothetical protein
MHVTTALEKTPWHPGARVARVKASHSYGFVLALLVCTFVFAATAPEESWVIGVLVLLQCATLIAALWTSGLGRSAVVPSVILAAIGIAAAIAQIESDSDTATGSVFLVSVLLALSTCVVIAFGILDQQEVNKQSVLGAICIYLMLGLMFVFAYGAIAELQSGPFFVQGTEGTLALRLYFSFVTLATLGYGDYTASSDLGHTISITEALAGQLYLVTVLAVLVANLGRKHIARE